MSRSVRIIPLVLVIILLFSCTPEAPPSPTATNTSLPEPTETLAPTATDTPVPATATATETLEPTATFTLTPEPAAFITKQNAICRTGPTDDYEIVAYLLPETTGTIEGRNEDGSWWYVRLDDSGEACWLADLVLTTSGGLDGLAYVEPPPSPPTSTPAPPLIVYYLVLLDSGGPMKCGDSLYPVSTGKYRTGDIAKDVTAAMNGLFGNHDQYTGDLYNALYKSRLSVDDVTVNKLNGWVEVFTVGKIDVSKDDCDRSRITDQIWGTMRQFTDIPHFDVRWNGQNITDRLYSP